jgi:hypothetical protein
MPLGQLAPKDHFECQPELQNNCNKWLQQLSCNGRCLQGYYPAMAGRTVSRTVVTVEHWMCRTVVTVEHWMCRTVVTAEHWMCKSKCIPSDFPDFIFEASL